MSVFSELDKFGLGQIKEKKLYSETDKGNEENKKPVVIKVKPLEEQDFLYQKKFECPLCGETLTSLTVMTGKVHVKKYEVDLRPVYDTVDELKYDVIACPGCGYAALKNYFSSPTKHQIDAIRNGICMNYKPQKIELDFYSYEVALERYQLALANAMVKNAKNSEKAYICLKMSWLIRGMIEELETSDKIEDKEKIEKYRDDEKELISGALEGFLNALQTEDFPIAGMNPMTLDYILAALYMETGDYDNSLKVIGNVLGSRSANSRTKDKIRDLKDLVNEKKSAAKGLL